MAFLIGYRLISKGMYSLKIKIWFQNRRTKWKREYLSEWEVWAHQNYYAMHGLYGAAAAASALAVASPMTGIPRPHPGMMAPPGIPTSPYGDHVPGVLKPPTPFSHPSIMLQSTTQSRIPSQSQHSPPSTKPGALLPSRLPGNGPAPMIPIPLNSQAMLPQLPFYFFPNPMYSAAAANTRLTVEAHQTQFAENWPPPPSHSVSSPLSQESSSSIPLSNGSPLVPSPAKLSPPLFKRSDAERQSYFKTSVNAVLCGPRQSRIILPDTATGNNPLGYRRWPAIVPSVTGDQNCNPGSFGHDDAIPTAI